MSQVFENMKKANVPADTITFSALILACDRGNYSNDCIPVIDTHIPNAERGLMSSWQDALLGEEYRDEEEEEEEEWGGYSPVGASPTISKGKSSSEAEGGLTTSDGVLNWISRRGNRLNGCTSSIVVEGADHGPNTVDEQSQEVNSPMHNA